MKNFCFYVRKATKRGMDYTAVIYRIVKNKLEYVGATSWNTASYRGEVHEVYNALMSFGYIPKKYYNSSKSDWCSGGYYNGIVTDKYNIQELRG